MGEHVFDSGMRCCIIILKNEVITDDIRDGRGPLDVGVLGGIVDEQGDGGGCEGFGCAAAVEER